MLQPDPTFGAEGNYFSCQKAKCGLGRDDRCIPGSVLLPDGRDASALIREAEDFLNEHTFFQYDVK